jgi:hypothetical protein
MPKTIDPSAAPGAAGISARADRAVSQPADIAARDDLTSAQKIALLQQWEQDLRGEMVAEEESMTGTGTGGALADTLSAVLGALKHLGVGHDDREADHPVPTKHG